jgi:hypothetical protein
MINRTKTKVLISAAFIFVMSTVGFARIKEKQKLTAKLSSYDTIQIKITTNNPDNKALVPVMQEKLVKMLTDEKVFPKVVLAGSGASPKGLLLKIDLLGKKKTGAAAKLLNMDWNQFHLESELIDQKDNSTLSSFHVTGMVSRKNIGVGKVHVGLDTENAQTEEGLNNACEDTVSYLKKHK